VAALRRMRLAGHRDHLRRRATQQQGLGNSHNGYRDAASCVAAGAVRIAPKRRASAETMRDDDAKQMMLEIAASYERLVRYGVTLTVAEAAVTEGGSAEPG
jgi:hypothetical protein